MEEYLKLILKKEKYLRRIKEQIKALEKDLLMIQKELQNVYEQNGREYIKLNSLSKEDEEANRTSFVFLIMIFIAINGPMKQRKEPKKSHNKIVVPFSVNDRP